MNLSVVRRFKIKFKRNAIPRHKFNALAFVDDRLLVKPVAAALAILPGAKKQLPYEGAKPMLRVTNEQIEDGEFLAKLLDAMLPELPAPAKKKK